MSNYRKLLPALLGALAQVLTLLDQAVGQHALPASWVPWAQAVIALATAAGVWAAPKNVPAAGPPPDAGRARAVLLIAFAVLVLVGASAAPALAHGRERPSAVFTLHVPEVQTAIGECGGAHRTYLTVRTLTGDRTGTWTAGPAGPSVLVEGWFEEGWHTPTQGRTPDGGVLADAGWGRWRAYEVGPGGRRVATGPPLSPNPASDTCGVFGDAPHDAKAA